MMRPTVTAMTTPARKEAESLRGLEAVTKMSADMICGPAFIVMARGRIARFITLTPLAFVFLQQWLRYKGFHLKVLALSSFAVVTCDANPESAFAPASGEHRLDPAGAVV